MKTIPRKKAGRPSNRPDPDYLIILYEKFSAAKIAEMYHVSASTVRSWVSRLRKEYEQDG